MQRKLIFPFTMFLLFSLVMASVSLANARAATPASGSARANISNPTLCLLAEQQPVNVLFFDDMESGGAKWVFGAPIGSISDWGIVSPGISGTHSLSGPSQNLENDSYAAMKADVNLPGGTSYLYFNHVFDFENLNDTQAYDGGVLEYSANQGGTWQDAHPLFSAGQNYNSTVFPVSYYGNPLGGRPVFSGFSNSMVASRYNLSSLAGQSIRFRWRTGTDYNVASNTGWQVDDVKIYTCPATFQTFLPLIAR